MPILLILTNCPDADTARAIGSALVSERLAACYNLGAGIESAYHWRGEIAREGEVPLLLKTREGLWDRAANRIRELHPYEVPAIIGTLSDYVTDDYAAWVHAETVDP